MACVGLPFGCRLGVHAAARKHTSALKRLGGLATHPPTSLQVVFMSYVFGGPENYQASAAAAQLRRMLSNCKLHGMQAPFCAMRAPSCLLWGPLRCCPTPFTGFAHLCPFTVLPPHCTAMLRRHCTAMLRRHCTACTACLLQGGTMGEVHRDMIDKQGLRNRHFDLIKSHLAETLQAMGVKQVGWVGGWVGGWVVVLCSALLCSGGASRRFELGRTSTPS